MSAFPPVVIREVGLRDGLQSIARVLPTAQKLKWIRDAWSAGQREIEVGSFVPARLLPQLADTAELGAFAKTLPDLAQGSPRSLGQILVCQAQCRLTCAPGDPEPRIR